MLPPLTTPDAEHAQRTKRLGELDALLAGAGAGAGNTLRLERARLLDRLDRTAAARAAYLELLGCDRTCADALNELGRLLDRTGYGAAARTLYAQAVRTHPRDPVGHGNLATSLLDAGDIETAQHHYEIAVDIDPANAAAHQCLAIIAARAGDAERAARHARIGFVRNTTAWPYRGTGIGVPVIVIHSALGGNIALDRFIDDRIFAKYTVVAEFADPDQPLPPHALCVNLIGDADRCDSALRAAQTLLARSTAPIFNAPAAVRTTGRAGNAERFASIPGVRTPRTASFSRARLDDPIGQLEAAGFGWPLIVRAPGFHTGQHCWLVAEPSELEAALRALPGDAFLAIEYVDVRDAAGHFRKYRVMIVGGTVLPLHLALSKHWMVHYFRSDMSDSEEHRTHEAAFLDEPAATLGSGALQALSAIGRTLALDYAGIDFAFDARGDVVVFEANATMNIVPPAAGDRWNYRRPALERVEAAVRERLHRKVR